MINCHDFIHFPCPVVDNEVCKRFTFGLVSNILFHSCIPCATRSLRKCGIILIFRKKFYRPQTHAYTQHTEMICREISIVLKPSDLFLRSWINIGKLTSILHAFLALESFRVILRFASLLPNISLTHDSRFCAIFRKFWI